MLYPSYGTGTQSSYYVHFIYSILFFWFINIIFLNIIFGIIIDTFAELRDEKSRRDFDMKNNCYICNLDRHTVIYWFIIVWKICRWFWFAYNKRPQTLELLILYHLFEIQRSDRIHRNWIRNKCKSWEWRYIMVSNSKSNNNPKWNRRGRLY